MTYFRHRISGPGPAGDVWVTTLHQQMNVGNILTAHTGMVAFVDDFFGAHYKTFCSPGFHLSQVVTDQLDDVTGHTINQRVTGRAIVGTGAGQQISPRSCLVVTLDTDMPGRAQRGRLYLPSPDAGHYNDDGTFVDAVCQDTANAFQSAMGDMNGVGPTVVYHRATKTGSIVYNIRVGNIPGTQRRRTNKTPNKYAIA
jgi:hypothetical protein